MKRDRLLRRRLLELGILPGQDIQVIRHINGYILQVRNCTYIICEDGVGLVLEIIGEI